MSVARKGEGGGRWGRHDYRSLLHAPDHKKAYCGPIFSVWSMASKYVTSPSQPHHANQREEHHGSPRQDENEMKGANATYNIDAPNQHQVLRGSASTTSEIRAKMDSCASYVKKKATEFVKYEMGDLQHKNPKVRLDDTYTEDGDEIYVETEPQT